MVKKSSIEEPRVALVTVNSSPSQDSPTESGPSRSSQGDQSDKHSPSGSVETPLSAIKFSPLSMFINNKVGSSFRDQQQALINSNQNARIDLILPVTTRKVRDSGAFLFMLAFLAILGYVIWDGLVVKQADINLIVHGHDSYGNICGRNNQPIKLAPNSGRNYTNKPYTKYTLINAQFERYTLDSDRLKQGELYYIKQTDLFETERAARLRSKQHFQTSLYNNPRIRRHSSSTIATPTSQSQHESQKINQISLQSLKSSLMYRYPPLYGYSPSPLGSAPTGRPTIADRSKHFEPLTTTVTITSAASMASTSEAPVTSHSIGGSVSESRLSHPIKSGPNAFTSTLSQASAPTLTSTTNAAATPTTTTTTSTTTSTTAAFHDATSSIAKNSTASSNTRIEVTTSLHSRQASFVNNPTVFSAINSQRQTSSRSNTPKLAFIFDDHANESEHMLITPTNTNPIRAKAPSGLNYNEVSSQLLYLTECVDYCPQDHVELIFFRCMPSNWRFSLFPNAINVTRTFIDDFITDLSHCYRELIYIFSLALVLSLAFLIMIRFLASIIIWACILLLVSLFISMASYSWMNYYNQVMDLSNMMPHDTIYVNKLAQSDKWLIGSIFLTFIAFATVGAIIFMRKRILLVTKLFRESGKAIADMPFLLLQPVLTFATLVIITILWILGLICLQSMKVPVIDFHSGFVVFKAEMIYKVMKWYHIFAFLWVSHFAIACQHYVIGSAVSKWYFSTNRYNLHSPIGISVSELVLYYLGSVALGSFLVAIFKVIRIIMRQIQYLVQRNCMTSANSNNPASSSYPTSFNSTHLSPSCCNSFSYVWRLFIWFFDNIVMIINRDAYVEIAIHGHSFLSGARRAFNILATNPLKLLAIKSVSNILLTVTKVCVVLATVSMALILLDEKTDQLNYSWSPLLVVALYAYIVAHWFLSVYEMVIDALFICYCEDYERSKEQENLNQLTGSNFMSQILSNGHLY